MTGRRIDRDPFGAALRDGEMAFDTKSTPVTCHHGEPG